MELEGMRPMYDSSARMGFCTVRGPASSYSL